MRFLCIGIFSAVAASGSGCLEDLSPTSPVTDAAGSDLASHDDLGDLASSADLADLQAIDGLMSSDAGSGCPATGAFDTEASAAQSCTKVVYAVGGRGGRRSVINDSGTALLDYIDSRFLVTPSPTSSSTEASTADHHKTWSVAIGRGVIVFIGNLGTFVSTDGVTFTRLTMGSDLTSTAEDNAPDDMHAGFIRFANNRFVAVSGATAWYSDDGMTWTRSYNSTWSGHVSGLAFGNGHWVAVDGANTLASSDNGQSWTTGTIPQSFNAATVAYGAGHFVARAIDASVNVTRARSTDGLSWTDIATSAIGFRGPLVYGNSTFFGTSSVYDTDGATSADGLTFTRATFSRNVGAMAFYAGAFASSYRTSANECIGTSPDGITQTQLWCTAQNETSSFADIAVGRIRK